MDNNNISPEYMMKGSPMMPAKYEADLYNAPNPPVHQRAQMSVEELSEASHVTTEKAISIAYSPAVYHAELWQKRIAKVAKPGSPFAELLIKWSLAERCDVACGVGVLFVQDFAAPSDARDWTKAVDPPAGLTDQQVSNT